MQLKIGTHQYAVRVAAKPIMDEHGSKDGLCDPRKKELAISPEVPATSRLWVLAHEMTHAWLAEVGRPKREEDVCNFVANLFVQGVRDLTKNGGEFALYRLSPGESPQPGASRVMLTKGRACGSCRGTVVGGSVVCEPDPGKPGSMLLRIYCEHCNHLQIWRELATPTGIPSGTFDGDPWYGTREEVQAFLKEHGELYGVQMVG